MRYLGLTLVALSFLPFGGLLVLPFVDLPAETKLALTPALVLLGEACFWLGGLLVGKEVISRYKKYLHPGAWFRPPAGKDDAPE